MLCTENKKSYIVGALQNEARIKKCQSAQCVIKYLVLVFRLGMM